ncbi:MAG: hypothetical protein ACREVA_00110 [Burkholderiales bacterium]
MRVDRTGTRTATGIPKAKGGNRKGAGRPKGSKTKRLWQPYAGTFTVDDDPIEGLRRIAKLAEENGDAPLAVSCLKEIASYVYPKLKAMTIELTNEESGRKIDLKSLPDDLIKQILACLGQS